MAPVRDGGPDVHGSIDDPLAADVERVQRLLSAVLPASASRHADVPRHALAEYPATARRYHPGVARSARHAAQLFERRRTVAARPICGGHRTGARRTGPGRLFQVAAAAYASVFRDRATARPTIIRPQASSGRICGHSTVTPIPFRKMPRTMMMK